MTDPTFTLLAAPVVDLDGTFFVQGGFFLALCLLLNFVLFQPWLKLRDLRVDRIDGALARSVAVLAEAQQIGADYDARIKVAREEAMGTRSASRVEAEGREADALGEARAKAADMLTKARAEIDAGAAQARSALGTRVDALATDVVSKILGRNA